MKVIRAKDSCEAGAFAAELIAAQVKQKPDCVLGLATGSTPLDTYAQLIAAYRAGELDFSCVRTVNLDEYVGLGPDHDQSYAWFMRHNLFEFINIDPHNTHIPDGITADPDAECQRYDALIASLGGVDLQLLGIGPNAHIGFNEPGDAFIPETHVVKLTDSTIAANARFFASVDQVPRQAITMGIRAILQARKVVLIATGTGKAKAVCDAFWGPVTPLVPASILQLHPDFTLVADEDALSLTPSSN